MTDDVEEMMAKLMGMTGIGSLYILRYREIRAANPTRAYAR